MQKHYTPLSDCLIIKSREVEKITKGGIIIPDNANMDEYRDPVAIVLTVGDDYIHLYKAGDLVIPRFASTTVIPGEKNLFVVNGQQILCKVTEEEIFDA